MITQKTYIAPVGFHILPTTELANKRVYVVHREGLEYDLISVTLFGSQGFKAIGRQVYHWTSIGFLVFDETMPFAGDIFGDRNLQEKINVIYLP